MNDSASLNIRLIANAEEATLCARWMAATEPWITLRRDFDHSFKLITDSKAELYVALQGKIPVGYILIDMNGAFAGYLRVVIVGPQFRGHGYGEKLVRFAEQRIFRASPNVFLCVSSFNQRAQAFYEKLGYERIGELKNYVVRGSSEFLMRKSISPKSEFKAAS